jgi:hypothetical protein
MSRSGRGLNGASRLRSVSLVSEGIIKGGATGTPPAFATPRIPEARRPPVRAAMATLSSCALRPSRDNPPASAPPRFRCPRPSAGPFGGATVPLTWQNQGKRYLRHDPGGRQSDDYRHAVPLRTHPTPLVRQQAVERRFGEPTRDRRLRAGTSAAERDHGRRYSEGHLRMSAWCFSPKTTFNYGATCRRRGDYERRGSSGSSRGVADYGDQQITYLPETRSLRVVGTNRSAGKAYTFIHEWKRIEDE